jgi:Ca-activated chloride channel family protein
MILATDGVNNAGSIDPLTASDLAQTLGVKIYTIGVGTRGEAPYPVDDPIFGRQYRKMTVRIDDEVLTQIAERTGGVYYRATDADALKRIFEEIDELERTEIETYVYYRHEDLGRWALLPAGLLLGLEWLLGLTLLRRIP